MRFNDDNVDIDGELIGHLGKNELVVFAGAGVSSRAYPNQRENTYYPTFRELVREIAKRLQRKLSEQENTLLKQGYSDRILGEWERDGDDVHSIAGGILSENEDGQRIDLHRAIIRLFPEGSEARVVTTNFDNLLLRALEREGHGDLKWNCYEAPSLPPANRNRFQGICFLHGRVNTPREMILTDKDIGRACRGYIDKRNLLSAWALNDPIQVPPFLIDRVSYFLQTPELLRDFAGNDLNENWFDKLVEWGHFDCILKNTGTPNHSDFALLQKLINWLIRNPEKWMVKLAPYRKTINIFLGEELWRHVARLSGSNKIEVDCLRKLIEFFRPVIERDPARGFSYSAGELLKQFIGNGYIDDAVWICDVMARAETTVKRNYGRVYRAFSRIGQRY